MHVHVRYKLCSGLCVLYSFIQSYYTHPCMGEHLLACSIENIICTSASFAAIVFLREPHGRSQHKADHSTFHLNHVTVCIHPQRNHQMQHRRYISQGVSESELDWPPRLRLSLFLKWSRSWIKAPICISYFWQSDSKT